MNFLAHCFLAQPNAESLVGNLLGDFTRGANVDHMPKTVLLGLENHIAVDKFTDTHKVIKPIKISTSKPRKRFAGIMADVVFDYFLIKHWATYTNQNFDEFVDHCYVEIESASDLMHPRMLGAMQFMLNDDGLRINASLDGVSETLDRIAHKIRFKNKFAGAIEEVRENYDLYEASFMQLFPELKAHIELLGIEEVID